MLLCSMLLSTPPAKDSGASGRGRITLAPAGPQRLEGQVRERNFICAEGAMKMGFLAQTLTRSEN